MHTCTNVDQFDPTHPPTLHSVTAEAPASRSISPEGPSPPATPPRATAWALTPRPPLHHPLRGTTPPARPFPASMASLSPILTVGRPLHPRHLPSPPFSLCQAGPARNVVRHHVVLCHLLSLPPSLSVTWVRSRCRHQCHRPHGPTCHTHTRHTHPHWVH